jgi:hypothetical protein
MDLTLPIIGLLGAIGYKLSTSESTKKNKLNDNFLSREKPSSRHIYNSNFITESQLKERELSTLNYLKSHNPVRTNVIDSNVFNLDCNSERKDIKYCNDRFSTEESEDLLNGPLFKQNNDYLNPKYLVENYTNGPLSELSGLPMEMSHNNMMPYTTIKKDSQIMNNYDVFQTTLNKYTGNDKTRAPKNTEPFFQNAPERLPNQPAYTQLVDHQRFNTSQRISGVIPVDQTTVGKIPQQLIRSPVKTVDQLRSKINPKQIYEGRTNHKGGPTERADIESFQRKSRTEGMYELNFDRSTISSNIKANNASHAITGNYSNNRDKLVNEDILGTPSLNKSSYLGVSENFNDITALRKDAVNSNDSQNGIRNAKMNMYSQKDTQNNINNTYLKDQERDTTIANRYTGPAGKSSLGKRQTEYDESPAKITNKEMNLKEYIGVTSNPINAPMDYESQKNFQINHKVMKENYTSNGGRESGTNKNMFSNYKLNNKAEMTNYFSTVKKTSPTQTLTANIGEYKNNNKLSNTDFKERNQFFKPAPMNPRK